MIDLLIQNGINEEAIDMLDDYYLDVINTNIDDCLKIINYLKNIGIRDISLMFLNNTELFITSLKEVKDLFNRRDIDKIIELINLDISNVKLLYE